MTTTDTKVKKHDKRHPDLDSLYCINPDGSRNAVHPADVKGRYQRRKKIVWAILIAIYLVLPWIKVDGKPAFLLHIPTRSAYIFGNTYNAQDSWARTRTKAEISPRKLAERAIQLAEARAGGRNVVFVVDEMDERRIVSVTVRLMDEAETLSEGS